MKNLFVVYEDSWNGSREEHEIYGIFDTKEQAVRAIWSAVGPIADEIFTADSGIWKKVPFDLEKYDGKFIPLPEKLLRASIDFFDEDNIQFDSLDHETIYWIRTDLLLNVPANCFH